MVLDDDDDHRHQLLLHHAWCKENEVVCILTNHTYIDALLYDNIIIQVLASADLNDQIILG